MKNEKGISRRKFITSTTLAGIGTMGSAGLISSCTRPNSENGRKKETAAHLYNSDYSGKYLDRVAFPIGGIGAGMFCLEGTGAISHMSVHNHPDVFNEPCMFAAIYIKGIKNGAKVIEGQVPDWKKFGQPDSANGSGGASYGLPRFHESAFNARFPFAEIEIADD